MTTIFRIAGSTQLKKSAVFATPEIRYAVAERQTEQKLHVLRNTKRGDHVFSERDRFLVECGYLHHKSAL